MALGQRNLKKIILNAEDCFNLCLQNKQKKGNRGHIGEYLIECISRQVTSLYDNRKYLDLKQMIGYTYVIELFSTALAYVNNRLEIKKPEAVHSTMTGQVHLLLHTVGYHPHNNAELPIYSANHMRFIDNTPGITRRLRGNLEKREFQKAEIDIENLYQVYTSMKKSMVQPM